MYSRCTRSGVSGRCAGAEARLFRKSRASFQPRPPGRVLMPRGTRGHRFPSPGCERSALYAASRPPPRLPNLPATRQRAAGVPDRGGFNHLYLYGFCRLSRTRQIRDQRRTQPLRCEVARLQVRWNRRSAIHFVENPCCEFARQSLRPRGPTRNACRCSVLSTSTAARRPRCRSSWKRSWPRASRRSASSSAAAAKTPTAKRPASTPGRWCSSSSRSRAGTARRCTAPPSSSATSRSCTW